MTDILERLKRTTDPVWQHTRDEVIQEAIEEIEELRADNEILRAANQELANYAVDVVGERI